MVMGLLVLETGTSCQDPDREFLIAATLFFFSPEPLALPIRLLVCNGDVEAAVSRAGYGKVVARERCAN